MPIVFLLLSGLILVTAVDLSVTGVYLYRGRPPRGYRLRRPLRHPRRTGLLLLLGGLCAAALGLATLSWVVQTYLPV